MTVFQHIITIALCALATMITRCAPFIVFPSGKTPPAFIRYLGRVLPGATFGMLVVYCLKGVDVTSGSHGLPELISVLLIIVLHMWKRNMLLSIAGGTAAYMLLVQFVF